MIIEIFSLWLNFNLWTKFKKIDFTSCRCLPGIFFFRNKRGRSVDFCGGETDGKLHEEIAQWWLIIKNNSFLLLVCFVFCAIIFSVSSEFVVFSIVRILSLSPSRSHGWSWTGERERERWNIEYGKRGGERDEKLSVGREVGEGDSMRLGERECVCEREREITRAIARALNFSLIVPNPNQPLQSPRLNIEVNVFLQKGLTRLTYISNQFPRYQSPKKPTRGPFSSDFHGKWWFRSMISLSWIDLSLFLSH